ncbi:MAG: hypothetical protein EBQ75_03075 [Actinobacteria bacterium]|nr:hypothetical protein [Actinomycetota bacterium]
MIDTYLCELVARKMLNYPSNEVVSGNYERCEYPEVRSKRVIPHALGKVDIVNFVERWVELFTDDRHQGGCNGFKI